MSSEITEAFVYEAIRTPRGKGKSSGTLHGREENPDAHAREV